MLCLALPACTFPLLKLLRDEKDHRSLSEHMNGTSTEQAFKTHDATHGRSGLDAMLQFSAQHVLEVWTVVGILPTGAYLVWEFRNAKLQELAWSYTLIKAVADACQGSIAYVLVLAWKYDFHLCESSRLDAGESLYPMAAFLFVCLCRAHETVSYSDERHVSTQSNLLIYAFRRIVAYVASRGEHICSPIVHLCTSLASYHLTLVRHLNPDSLLAGFIEYQIQGSVSHDTNLGVSGPLFDLDGTYRSCGRSRNGHDVYTRVEIVPTLSLFWCPQSSDGLGNWIITAGDADACTGREPQIARTVKAGFTTAHVPGHGPQNGVNTCTWQTLEGGEWKDRRNIIVRREGAFCAPLHLL